MKKRGEKSMKDTVIGVVEAAGVAIFFTATSVVGLKLIAAALALL